MNRRVIKLWNSFEHFHGFTFPSELKNILNICGFDSEFSLEEINEETIKQIEQNVNENLIVNNLDTISALKGSIYEQKPLPFHFLLGQKFFILNIPEKIEQLNKNMNKNEKIIPEEPQKFSPEYLKESLIQKLKTYADKKKLNFEIKSDHIKKFSVSNKIANCRVRCCFCEIETPCNLDGYWRISNLIKHIRGHTECTVENYTDDNNDNISIASETMNQALNTPALTSKPSIIRAQENVLQQVNNIVRCKHFSKYLNLHQNNKYIFFNSS